MSNESSMTSLSERIAAVLTTSSHSPHLNRGIVLALRADISQALDDGWSVLAIYKVLRDEGQVHFSYQAFRRHVNNLLSEKMQKRKQPTRAAVAHRKAKSHNGTTGFVFNTSMKKEDLL